MKGEEFIKLRDGLVSCVDSTMKAVVAAEDVGWDDSLCLFVYDKSPERFDRVNPDNLKGQKMLFQTPEDVEVRDLTDLIKKTEAYVDSFWYKHEVDRHSQIDAKKLRTSIDVLLSNLKDLQGYRTKFANEAAKKADVRCCGVAEAFELAFGANYEGLLVDFDHSDLIASMYLLYRRLRWLRDEVRCA